MQIYNKEKLVHKYPILGSSADPDKVSATVKGLLIALVPIIISVAQYYEVELAESMVMEIINAVGAIVAAGVTIFGAVRKMKKFK